MAEDEAYERDVARLREWITADPSRSGEMTRDQISQAAADLGIGFIRVCDLAIAIVLRRGATASTEEGK